MNTRTRDCGLTENALAHSMLLYEFWCSQTQQLYYRTRAIITRGLYTFYPLFEVHLCTVTLCMVSIQEWFLIKSGLQWRAYGIQQLKLVPASSYSTITAAVLSYPSYAVCPKKVLDSELRTKSLFSLDRSLQTNLDNFQKSILKLYGGFLRSIGLFIIIKKVDLITNACVLCTQIIIQYCILKYIFPLACY